MGCCFGRHEEPPPSNTMFQSQSNYQQQMQPLLMSGVPPPHVSPAEKARQLFHQMDRDASGNISLPEMMVALQDPTMQAALGWPSSRYQELFDLLDPARKGVVTMPTLEHYCKVRWLFDLIDSSHNSTISAWELEIALLHDETVRNELGVRPNLAQSLFRQMDTDGNGSISFVEFYRYYTQAALAQPHRTHDNWEQMALDMLQKMDLDRSGGVSLAELAAALRSDRGLELELGWPAHRASELFVFLDTDRSGTVSLENLRTFCRLQWLFNKIDVNRSGYIDAYELGAALADQSMQEELGTPVDQAQSLFAALDHRQEGNVAFPSFFRHFARRPKKPATVKTQSSPKNPAELYKVVKMIGEGGFGAVYLIERTSDKLPLIMKKPKLDSGVTMSEVQAEANMLQRLKHPNIVRFVDSYWEKGALIIITEYADGGDLRKQTPKNGFPQSTVLKYFKQILEAIKYLHDRRFLHRDLKPDNILLTKQSVIKVADLGLATQLKHSERQAQTQCGTPFYMAPEIHDCKPYDSKADMFSLGCILYEMSTGKLAFRSVAALIKGEIPHDIPHWSRHVVLGLLQANPSRRMSCVEAQKALSAPAAPVTFAHGIPPGTYNRPVQPYKIPRPVQGPGW